MRTVNVPSIGDVWVLGKPWTFTVVAEHRNEALMAYLESSGAIPKDAPRYVPEPNPCGATFTWFRDEAASCARPAGHASSERHHGHSRYPDRREHARYSCTLPRGVRLRVDRIYIRKGVKAYDSLTFWALDLPAKRVRFWARLADVNTMVITGRATPPKPVKVQALPIRAILLRE